MTSDDYKEIKFEDILLSAKKLFEFDDYDDWVDNATRRYGACGLNKKERERLTITLDAKGRLCRRGADFMQARDEEKFPVSVYILNFTV